MTNPIKTLLLISLLSISSHILAVQTCKSHITDNHLNSRYSVHNDGTVTDNQTGLMWKVCSQGKTWDNNNTDNNLLDDNCTGTGETYDWQEALIEADTETFATYSDWRVPNIKELRSLAAYNCYDPSINETIFPSTDVVAFWSASPYANFKYSSWLLYFGDGYDYPHNRTFSQGTSDIDDYNFGLRLLRSGQ